LLLDFHIRNYMCVIIHYIDRIMKLQVLMINENILHDTSVAIIVVTAEMKAYVANKLKSSAFEDVF